MPLLAPFNLPDELVQRALAKMDTLQLLRACQGAPSLRTLAEDRHVWLAKVLLVRTHYEARLALEQPGLLRRVRHLDFSHSACTTQEILAIIRGTDALVSVRFCNMEGQVSDELVTLLARLHGPSLRALYLDRSYQLTNAALEAIGQFCQGLESLSLYACMFSSLSIQRLAEAPCAATLRHFNLGRCHLVDFAAVRTQVQMMPRLTSLVLASNDSVLPLHLTELVRRARRLKRLDITDCIEICRKDIQTIERLRPLEIMHSSRLDDFSPASIRAYLLSIEGLVTH